MVQATGDYAGAKELIAQWGILHPSMSKLIASLKDIPVDIEPEHAFDER